MTCVADSSRRTHHVKPHPSREAHAQRAAIARRTDHPRMGRRRRDQADRADLAVLVRDLGVARIHHRGGHVANVRVGRREQFDLDREAAQRVAQMRIF